MTAGKGNIVIYVLYGEPIILDTKNSLRSIIMKLWYMSFLALHTISVKVNFPFNSNTRYRKKWIRFKWLMHPIQKTQGLFYSINDTLRSPGERNPSLLYCGGLPYMVTVWLFDNDRYSTDDMLLNTASEGWCRTGDVQSTSNPNVNYFEDNSSITERIIFHFLVLCRWIMDVFFQWFD